MPLLLQNVQSAKGIRSKGYYLVVVHILKVQASTKQIIRIMENRKNVSRKKNSTGMLALLAILQVLDGVLTYIGVSHQYADEGNPIVLFLMGHLGILGGLIAVKTTALLFILFVHKRKINGRISSVLLACNVAYIVVVASWVLILTQ